MLFLIFLLSAIHLVAPHGRIIQPPGRSSMWRYGFNTPRNYDDNALFCGGRARQWENNNGKCGICGDAYDDPWPRSNEAGGLFATGTISGHYRRGEVIDIVVEVTANHGGHFEFRLCPLHGYMREATERCLDRYKLQLHNNQRHWYIPSKVSTNYTMSVQLPPDITCRRCVLQWKWVTANSWGCDENEECCIGCGPQENFVNCADISIGGSAPARRVPQQPVQLPARPTVPSDEFEPTVLSSVSGRDLSLPNVLSQTGPVEPRDSFQFPVGIQPQDENKPILARAREQPSVAPQQETLYSASGSPFAMRPGSSDGPETQSSRASAHNGEEYSSRGHGRTGTDYQNNNAKRPLTSQNGNHSRPRTISPSSVGYNTSPTVLNRLAAALKAKSSRCRLKYRLQGFSMNCGNLCKPVGSRCISKLSLSVMDAACDLMCSVG